MPLIKTERAEIFYEDYRKEPNTTPLILIHGAGGNHEDWPIELCKSTNAIAVDLAGHGKSPLPSRNTVAEYAADIVSLLETLKLDTVMIAGHSMGGAICLTIALDYPQYVKNMILLGTSAKLEVNPALINGLQDKPEETIGLINKWLWAKHIADDIKANSAQRLLATPFKVTRGDFIACDGFDVRDRLGDITVPTLILTGTVDKMTPFEWSKNLVDNIPNASLETIENGGHMFHLEQAEKTRDVILAWIEKL